MKKNLLKAHWSTKLLAVLRLLLIFLIAAVLTGIKIPFMPGDKAKFFALVVAGVITGSVSNWDLLAVMKRMNNPITITASIIGAAASLLVFFTIIGIGIPFIGGYRKASLVLSILLIVMIGFKILLTIKKSTKWNFDKNSSSKRSGSFRGQANFF